MNYAVLEKLVDDMDQRIEENLESCMDDVIIDDRKLKECLTDQIKLQMIWETMYAKTKSLRDQIEAEMETIFAGVVEKEMKDTYRSTSITEAKEFAKANVDYVQLRRLFIRASGLHHDAKSALETVTTRKYVLNNVTNLVIASSEHHII